MSTRLHPGAEQIIGNGAIYTSSSFKKRNDINTSRSSLSYARVRGPNVEYLEKQLQKLYDCEYVALCCSGMNAIGCVLAALRPRHLVLHNESYKETRKLCDYEMRRNGVIDVVDLNAETTPNDDVDMVLFESCTNPSGRFIEISKVRKLYLNAVIIVDNTTLSGVIYNPLKYDDKLIVVESLTKYVGAGEVIAGAIYSNNYTTEFAIVWEWICKFGIRISPQCAYSITTSLTTLEMRITKVSDISLEIAKKLQKLPFIGKVCYPMLESGVDYNIALKYIKMGAGMIWFNLKGVDKVAAIRLMDSSELIHYATSYGKAESLFDPYFAIDKSGVWIRLSVGYTADVDKLWNELLRLFVDHSGQLRRVYDIGKAPQVDIVKINNKYYLKGEIIYRDINGDVELYNFNLD